MSLAPRDQIARSWRDNAAAWTAVVRAARIESRRVATDGAILDAIRAHHPGRLLDVGCGEGWLCRTLGAEGVDCTGFDASPELIDAARAAGGARFEVADYGALEAFAPAWGRFDAIVCNFSLLDEVIAPLLQVLRQALQPQGRLLIQSVHPWSACGETPYRNGWRTESFASFGGAFATPMPWYFRTLSAWIDEINGAGLRLEQVQEPAHPDSGAPLSLLMTARSRRA
jgi:2-polyprenyl-3-methyl-5-hydroxy-6-metoxy-1,4-benzoquinol methylase